MKFRSPYSIFSRFFISSRKLTLILNRVKLDKRKNNFFYNSALKWNQVNRLLITPYIIKIHSSSIGNVIHDNSDTVNYDFALSVSTYKNKLREIIHAAQSQGDELIWCPANFELTACHISIEKFQIN